MHRDTPYEQLTPEVILDSIEAVGFEPTGGLIPLNSYENRVYQVALENGDFVVAKFYRPDRWSEQAILEEHEFTLELLDAELSVVPPLSLSSNTQNRDTLREHNGYKFAIFERKGGHPPNIEDEDTLRVLCRTIGRLHSEGSLRNFTDRQQLTVEEFGWKNRTTVLEAGFLPPELEAPYASISEELLVRADHAMKDVPMIRIHGDCHMGNILWRNEIPHFIDFDDCLMGPPIQDLWMLLNGDFAAQLQQAKIMIEAYRTFSFFDESSLRLIEPLRALRMIKHAAWIANRWIDPAFPRAFPTFNTHNYWSNHILELKEQLSKMDEPNLYYS